MKTIVCLIWFGMMASGNLSAQELYSPFTFGIKAGIQQSMFQGNFKELPGTVNCCNGYSGNSTMQDIYGGIEASYAFGDVVSFDAELVYTRSRAEYYVENIIGNALQFNGSNVVITEGLVGHTVQFGIPSIGITPSLTITPFESVGLGIRAGFRYFMQFASDMSGNERLISPEGIVFADTKTAIRNDFTGTFTPAKNVYGPMVGLRYIVRILPGTIIIPELSYTHFLNDPIVFANPQEQLSFSALRAGVEIAFNSQQEKSPEPEIAPTIVSIPPSPLPIVEPDTIPVYVPREIKGIIQTSGIDGESHEQSMVNVSVEEYTSLTMTPLLNYVFFDEMKSDIPSRYARIRTEETSAFSSKNYISSNHVETYHQILNIIGKRLKEKPNAILSLTGCNADIQDEKGNRELSKARAESIKDYLQSVWSISNERLQIFNRNLPEKHANTETLLGAQENRRVEISSNDPYIISPIVVKDTIRTLHPASIRFRPSLAGVQFVQSWQLIIGKKDKELHRFFGKENIPAYIDWHIDSSMIEEVMSDTTLTFTFEAKTALQDSASIKGGLPVEKITVKTQQSNKKQEREVNTFSLILFDIRSSEIGTDNKTIIEYIKSFIKPQSIVSVTGFTDTHGNEKTNQNLAEKRALGTASMLGIPSATIKGQGNAILYDEKYPEGRLYTRTVRVIVDTKTDK